MASTVPGTATPQVASPEDVVTGATDGPKLRKHKKRRGHRSGSTKEHKDQKRGIMTPMNDHEEEALSLMLTASLAPSPKATATPLFSAASLPDTPTQRHSDSRSDIDIIDKHADWATATSGVRSVVSPLSPAQTRSEHHVTRRQQAEQEKEQLKDREKEPSKEKPNLQQPQTQEQPVATTELVEWLPPAVEATQPKPMPPFIQGSMDAASSNTPKPCLGTAKTEDTDGPPLAATKEITSTSESSWRILPASLNYSVVITIALLSAGAAVVGLLMWLQADHVEVRTKSGSSVRGYRSYASSHRIYTFLGIPYAQPPLHQLRFRLPVVASENGSVVQATLDCPPCPQKDWFSGSNEGWDGAEECLHLNVWTPCAETTAGGGCEKQPVLVFLYAEGFQTGSNQRFDGSLLAASENLVVVAPNFRLGVLGFFHKDGHEMPGNLALHDQELVVKWVQEHVELFGGDWNNTVFMGAATGAWSIGAHLVSTNPVWRWRTQRLLLHSESPFRRVYTANPAAFAEAVGCGQNQSSSSCFTELPLQTVLEAGRHFPFGPNYECRLLPQAPWHMARRFNIIEKQVILGTVYNEGSPLVEILERDGDASDSYMRGAVQELLTSYGVNESGKLVEQYTSGTWTGQRGMNLSWAHLLLGDVFFECPVLSFALHLSTRGNRVYVYRFDYKPTFSRFAGQSGPSRLEDVEFLFGTPIQHDMGNSQEKVLSSRMMRMLSTFIRNGSLPKVDGEEWPLYTTETKKRVSITSEALHVLPEDSVERCHRLGEAFLPELMFGAPT
ncbi:acetylcholinesterase-like [Dermacentor andersoni]|uniref:acetylcholinesterase-like n=1 Tax=Dermacentor andersoni TaxID=34620 RepID=UPI003B3B39F0